MKIEYKNGSVIITVPASESDIKKAELSKSGKSKMVATTSGFKSVDGAPGGLKVSLNVTASKE